MQKIINPETHRPYTISMIERFKHEIQFAVDPNSSSKKQNFSSLEEKLSEWKSTIVSQDESGRQYSIVCLLGQRKLFHFLCFDISWRFTWMHLSVSVTGEIMLPEIVNDM